MNIFARTDTQLFHWIFNWSSQSNSKMIRWVSKTGDGHLYLGVGVILWMFDPQDGPLFFSTALMAYALELPLYVLLKKSVKRKRPCDLMGFLNAHITPSDKFSLPSGHTAAAFLMAALLAHFYPSVAIFVYCWASMIGISRVLLGVHYPSDILAGAALGMTISFISFNFLA